MELSWYSKLKQKFDALLEGEDYGKAMVVIFHHLVSSFLLAAGGYLNYREGLGIGMGQIIIAPILLIFKLYTYFGFKDKKFFNIVTFALSVYFDTAQVWTGGNSGFGIFTVLSEIPTLFYIMDMKYVTVLNYSKFIIFTVMMWTPAISQQMYPYNHPTLDRFPIMYLLIVIVCHYVQIRFNLALAERDKSLQLAIEYGNQVEVARKEAVYANRAKSQFLSNMSHDIRTPMNAIVGYTAIAAANIDKKDRVKDCIENITIASTHLQGLINDVLDMSRIESGREEIKLTKTSISELVRGVLPMVQSKVQEKHLELYIDTLDLKNEAVYADTQKVRQVLLNIIGNAVKYTGEGGHIGIRVKENRSNKEGCAQYKFTIKDNGIGMSQEFLKRVFDPFEQERTNEESGIEGTGLGTSIAKRFVEMMGGTISVESELGKGSEFTIVIDLKLQEDVVRDDRIDQLKGFRALVVDDDFQTCDSITHMLTDVGMRSDWTTSSRDAVLRAQKAVADNDPFFAYIIDWIMPEMNGIELTRQIRRIVGDDIPIIILTAYSWGDIAEEAKAAGVTALCTKPLFVSDLTSIFLDNIDVNAKKSEPVDTFATTEVSFNGEHVLLVEDNKMNRKIATFQLNEMGLKVTPAENGKVALDTLLASEDGEFDFVLMDMRMPVMDGLTATKQIRLSDRKYLQELPIIALTANAFSEDVDACLAAGMNAHVAKPFTAEHLGVILKGYQKKQPMPF